MYETDVSYEILSLSFFERGNKIKSKRSIMVGTGATRVYRGPKLTPSKNGTDNSISEHFNFESVFRESKKNPYLNSPGTNGAITNPQNEIMGLENFFLL